MDTIETPRISIVTVSYNQGSFLQAAIDSVVKQADPCVEYIVVDGGSSDNTLQVLRSNEHVITKWISEEDQGPADALNKGFALATGEILAYLNSDDVFLDGAFNTIRQVFAGKTSERLVVYGDGVIIDANGVTSRRVTSTRWSPRRYALGGAVILQQATFFTRAALSATKGFNPNNKTCWDGELLLDLARAGSKFVQIHAELGGFRIHAESITGSGRTNERFLSDTKRLEHSVLGRECNGFERHVVRNAYRAENAVRHIVRLMRG